MYTEINDYLVYLNLMLLAFKFTSTLDGSSSTRQAHFNIIDIPLAIYTNTRLLGRVQYKTLFSMSFFVQYTIL